MRRAPFIVAAGILISAGGIWEGSKFFASRKERALPPIQLEVGDRLPREVGVRWVPGDARILLIVTSATCGPCNEDREFEDGLASLAVRSGVPAWYLLSSDPAQDTLAKDLAQHHYGVLRGRLSGLGLARTPTFVAVNRQGTIIAIRTGSVRDKARERVTAELLYGTSKPLYSRVDMRTAQLMAARADHYGMIELALPAAAPFRGAQYRVIRPDELSIRARHEFDRNSPLFLDCNSAGSPTQCQSALLALSQGWPQERLFAIDLERGLTRQ